MSGGSAEMATSWSLPLTVSFGFLVVWCAFNRGSTKPIPRTGPSASGSIGGIRQFAFVDGKASGSDTLRQAFLDTLEFDAQSPRIGIRSGFLCFVPNAPLIHRKYRAIADDNSTIDHDQRPTAYQFRNRW